MRRFQAIILLSALALPSGQDSISGAQAAEQNSGFIMAAGWELVQSTCTVCHSAQLIVQNSGSREVWLSRIRWMQDSQGLQQLTPTVESSILDYLATNYGPKEATRRAGLTPDLLPDNPYNR